MTKECFCGNRNRLDTQMKDHSLLTLFSGIGQIGFAADFEAELRRLAASGSYEHLYLLYLDLYRASPADRDAPAHRLPKRAASDHPFLNIENANFLIHRLRTLKQPCELDAMCQAERITCEGIHEQQRFAAFSS